MRRLILVMIATGFILCSCTSIRLAQQNTRRLPVKEYVDKMKAGWIGQMAGVGWGGPTEFKWKGQIIPEANMPAWRPEMINQFKQDDIYVEMTFLRTLELYGLDCSIRQAGIDFANSGYRLWHANRNGRDNLRKGIAPPDSGHPAFNKHADDIDYQIEADYSGLIAPGLPNVAIELGEKFGRLMNYGDGLYGGQFVGGMYAEAFFEDDMEKIVLAGLECIPQDSQYAECIRDVLTWYRQNPDDWQKTWQLINEKYHLNPDYRRFSCGGAESDFNIDAKINGAYIVMGLLYGQGDPDKTIIISTCCGQDSDCNPSNAGGILFTTMGFSKLPERFTSALDPEGKFSHTPYNFPTLIQVCKELARLVVLRAGGWMETDADGELVSAKRRAVAGEVFVIPIQKPKPSELEQCDEPGPIANSYFTEEELAKLEVLGMPIAVERFAPGWKISNCGDERDAGLHREMYGKRNVLVTHPLNRDTGCVLAKSVKIPEGKKTKLSLVVNHHPKGDWVLLVKANGEVLLNMLVGKENTDNGWMQVEVDLSKYTGQEVHLELTNEPNNWEYEAAYWAEIKFISE